MAASYALEGKKDNISISFAVAAKLLDDEHLYLSLRDKIKGKGVDVTELNRYHKLLLGHWQVVESGSYYRIWTKTV